MKNEDKDMYNAIRKGNIKSFERFYRKNQPRLFTYGMGILDDEEATKDLVQDAFITFWEQREHIIADYSVTAYLFRIFHNNCLKYLRMKAIQSNFSQLSELKIKEMEISFYQPDKNILGSVFMHDVEDLYEKAVWKLPEQCREIFIMSKQEDMRSIEIAMKLGLSVRTVENQIYKAIHMLRQAMKEYALPVMIVIGVLNFFI
ncbi:MAG: RNA polymerase sigma-70 factor [Bacteroidota bacterium]|nr:RNA polymerase sigma-70 factor [Bacteroidota bacterium]